MTSQKIGPWVLVETLLCTTLMELDTKFAIIWRVPQGAHGELSLAVFNQSQVLTKRIRGPRVPNLGPGTPAMTLEAHYSIWKIRQLCFVSEPCSELGNWICTISQ